jgi:hypothetical protein
MSLLNEYMETCALYEKRRVSDGVGGWEVGYVKGAEFLAAIVPVSTSTAIIAEAQGMKKIFNVTTAKNAPLSFHDVFQRVSDGKFFRVTSDGADTKTPDSASFQVSQVTAEEYQMEAET